MLSYCRWCNCAVKHRRSHTCAALPTTPLFAAATAAAAAARRAEQLEASRGVLSREELELQDVTRQMEAQLLEQVTQVGQRSSSAS